MQGPAYSRHTLPGDTEPGEHPKEILILRHKSLRVEVSGADMTVSRTEKDDSYLAQGDSSPQPKLCRSFTVEQLIPNEQTATSVALGISSFLLTHKGEHFSYKSVFFYSRSGECRKGSGSGTGPLEVGVCHPTTPALRYDQGREERNGEGTDFEDVKAQVMTLVSHEGSDSVAWVATIRVDNVNKTSIEKDCVDRAKYPEQSASKRELSLHDAGFLKGARGNDVELNTSSASPALLLTNSALGSVVEFQPHMQAQTVGGVWMLYSLLFCESGENILLKTLEVYRFFVGKLP
ncbi:hypothetical protein AV530_003849 [Patagioenas fasciata monilis]|uniref:Uncharacterized protein n=1 Tax=Patagioenas fasciata monilis TaxID=372326 RepID=A0A1V4KZI0_PATFA|nr:hypothetical protein AV530_003849 [Patagioenas fasciata monilis]